MISGVNKKPEWLIYAQDARKQLDGVKPSKSGKREERCELSTWQTAREAKGYPGGFEDWQFLLRKLGRENGPGALRSTDP